MMHRLLVAFVEEKICADVGRCMRDGSMTSTRRASVLVHATLLLCFGWMTPVAADVPIGFDYHIRKAATGPFNAENDHPLVSTATISAKWALVNPNKDLFVWDSLEEKLDDWTAGGTNGKQVWIKVVPYGQSPDENSPYADNLDTPTWIYDYGVTRITFNGGGNAGGGPVSVPKSWEPAFLEVYGDFIQALAQAYDNDPRVAAGLLGTLDVRVYSRDLGRCFLQEGSSDKDKYEILTLGHRR